MATDLYLELAGIKGESNDKGKLDQVKLKAWRWAIRSPRDLASGAPTGRVAVAEIVVTKAVDASSIPLLAACWQNHVIETAVLTCRKAGKTPIDYYFLEMTKVSVLSVTPRLETGDEVVVEDIGLIFQEIAVNYAKQRPDGSNEATMSTNWARATN